MKYNLTFHKWEQLQGFLFCADDAITNNKPGIMISKSTLKVVVNHIRENLENTASSQPRN